MMIAAPLTVRIHSIDVAIDLRAAIAVACSVVVNAGAIVFEALMTRIAVIGLRVDGRPNC
jgi:hypothetical protein